MVKYKIIVLLERQPMETCRIFTILVNRQSTQQISMDFQTGIKGGIKTLQWKCAESVLQHPSWLRKFLDNSEKIRRPL